MLYWLGEGLATWFGPARLLHSLLVLAGTGTALAALATWWLLPRLWGRLPLDTGRAYAVGAEQSVGKPTSGGIVFVPTFAVVALVFVPTSATVVEVLALLLVAMTLGYLDDRQDWSDYGMAASDLALGLLGAAVVSQLAPVPVWLPVASQTLLVPPWIYVPVGGAVIWVSINATNSSDGVDGLAATLCSLAFALLGAFLYGVVGHAEVSRYLLVPHYRSAPTWGLLAFVMTGCLAGYLWHNAHPSRVLMGDAGSRPIGLLLGLLVLATGNPFVIFVVAFVVLANGGTGLLKVALLRFLRIGIFRSVRLPLHDHVRHSYGWSNSQVLIRFTLIQAVVMPILFVLLLKIR